MEKHRIVLLDSFRFIAIMCVMLFHFTYRGPNVFPYHDFYGRTFSFGYLGVEFFFMISGFVISYTLEHTAGFFAFWSNRFARLFPPMLLCSLITFVIIYFLDDQYLFRPAHQVKNLAPGLTFISPAIWAYLTNINFQWINGSYWSLWIEIQFYVIASGLYFLSKKHFFRNILLAGVGITLIKYIPINFLNNYPQYLHLHGLANFFESWQYGDEVFNITFFMCWFLPGVIFYHLYTRYAFKQHIFIIICSLFAVFCLLRDIQIFFADSFYTQLFACALMFVLFLLMIFRKKYLLFLEGNLLKRIGVISYAIYLIHESIGVLLINKYGKYLGDWSPLAPFIVIIIAIGFAELSYRFYERKAALFLKRILG